MLPELNVLLVSAALPAAVRRTMPRNARPSRIRRKRRFDGRSFVIHVLLQALEREPSLSHLRTDKDHS